MKTYLAWSEKLSDGSRIVGYLGPFASIKLDACDLSIYGYKETEQPVDFKPGDPDAVLLAYRESDSGWTLYRWDGSEIALYVEDVWICTLETEPKVTAEGLTMRNLLRWQKDRRENA